MLLLHYYYTIKSTYICRETTTQNKFCTKTKSPTSLWKLCEQCSSRMVPPPLHKSPWQMRHMLSASLCNKRHYLGQILVKLTLLFSSLKKSILIVYQQKSWREFWFFSSSQIRFDSLNDSDILTQYSDQLLLFCAKILLDLWMKKITSLCTAWVICLDNWSLSIVLTTHTRHTTATSSSASYTQMTH